MPLQTVFSLVKIILFTLIAVFFLLYFFQDSMIFFPRPLPPDNKSSFSNYEFSIVHKTVKLHGWLVKEQDPTDKPFIIYYGGNAEEISANLFDQKKFPAASLLMMNYRGYGESEGKPSEQTLCADALFIFDKIIEQQKIPPQNIILFGRSLGSGVATFVASQRQVGAVILVTAFDSLVNVAKRYYPIFPIRLMLRHKFDSSLLAQKISAPLLNIMAEHDEVVPNTHAQKLADVWLGPVESVIIRRASHNDISSFPEYWQTIEDYTKNIFQSKN